MKCKIEFTIIIVMISAVLFLQPIFAAVEDTSEIDSNAISGGINEFAFNLYAKIKDSPATKQAEGNLFFSPYSISTALVMTYTGARGNTAKEMAEVLCLPDIELEQIAACFGSLQNNLQADPEISGYELNIANALWLSKRYSLLPEFLDVNKKYFSSGINQIDFSQPVESAKIINTWIEEQTKEKIKNMISPEVIIPSFTELILTNAIYFKGAWVSPFQERNTKPADFHVTENKTVEVPMMYQREGRYGYYENTDMQLLQLPYGLDRRLMQEVIRASLNELGSYQELLNQRVPPRRGSNRDVTTINQEINDKIRKLRDEHRQNMEEKMRKLSMLILLPKTIGDLDSVENRLNQEMLQSYIEQIKQQEVIVYLPKFKIAFDTIELKDILIEMGMKDAFREETVADFSGMDGTKELFIYTVLHKTYIDVDEKGTEAAAATVVGVGRGEPPAAPPVFRADRPFIFMIRDNHTGSILFMGRVVNPTLKGE